MKLVFIITGLASGGAESMLLKLLQHIDRSRFTPTVISLTSTGVIGPHIEALGIPVKALLMRPGLPSPFKFVQLVNHLRQLSPDVVHTWMYHANLLGGLAARLSGVRKLIWGIHHCDLSADKNKKATLRVVRLCAYLSRWVPTAILSCSKQAKTIHVNAGYCAGKFLNIPNGFDVSRFVPDISAKVSVRTELGVHQDTLLVGMIARIDPQKNHEGFISAAAMVAHLVPNVHFLLAGTEVDAENARLVKLIAETGVQEKFHLLGRRDDIPRLMASLDLLASSSWGEAFPNVLGEAMACGIPCVVTDVGDSALIVGETGRVIPAGDMTGLAHAMRNMLEMSVTERSKLAFLVRKRVTDLFEIRSVVSQYEALYTSLAVDGYEYGV
jgi:glycosyltransferase involved in cell wall biosynthesis